MTTRQRDKDIKHWDKVVKTSKDWQQIHYAEYKIEQIREQWRIESLEEMKKLEGIPSLGSL